MAVRFLGIGREKARSKRRKREFENERSTALSGFNEVLGSLQGGVDEARNEAALSTTDLYGDSIARNTDSIRANANNTKSALSRAAAAQGGDVTGSRALAFDNIDSQANKGIGGVELAYENKADDTRARAKSRGDQLLSLLMSGNQSLFAGADANLQNEITRDLQRKQANKQLALDGVGTVLDLFKKPGK